MIADRIRRTLDDPDSLDFEGIRRSGVDLMQALSGQIWTDYNQHDPGVTLLEVLSYGLTDLAYRSDFDVADILTGPLNSIDFEQQALFPPERIFPSAPVTDVDFCKLIYDQLPQVDDVWIIPVLQGDGPNGLFTVFVKPRESLIRTQDGGMDVDRAALHDAVRAVLARHRNLGRDVERIVIVASQPYMLAGEIEIDDSRPAAEIYADLYVQCASLISSGGRVVRFEEARAAGMAWEEILTGPVTRHGYIEDRHFAEPNYAIDSIRLIALARHVRGVRQVGKLCLMNRQGDEIDTIRLAPGEAVCPVLAFPDDPARVNKLRLVHGKAPGRLAAGVDEQHGPRGRDALQFHEQVRLAIGKLEFNNQAFRSSDGQLERLVERPHGQYRPLDAYSSVAEHTPAIYGVNRYGVPASSANAVKARALQLKAYLYPFEQMMANYLASLQGIKRLYSIDPTLQRSYFARFLDNGAVPQLEGLYRDGIGKADIDAVLAGQDSFAERRNRVLDSLLAMFGEVFPDDALRRFALYDADDGHDAVELHLIDCKIGLLRHVCELSANRGRAVDLQAQHGAGENVAVIQQRVQLLSGMDASALGYSLTGHLLDGDIAYLSDTRYRARRARDGAPAEVAFEQTAALADAGWDDAALPLSPLQLPPQGAVSPALLRCGVQRANYRMLPADEGTGWLCLCVSDAACWPLMLLPSEQLALAAARMRRLLAGVNRRAEGFHVLEHVLLRPRGATGGRAVESDWYAHRVSVILPAFTARFADPACRAWIEELIAHQMPAHILPQFYWLDFALLAQFEQRHAAWLALLREHNLGRAPDGLDAAASQLIELLARNARHHTNRVWT